MHAIGSLVACVEADVVAYHSGMQCAQKKFMVSGRDHNEIMGGYDVRISQK